MDRPLVLRVIKAGDLPGGDHHLGCLDNNGHVLPLRESEPLGRRVGDRCDDLLAADVDHDFGHHRAVLDRFDRAPKLISCAQFHESHSLPPKAYELLSGQIVINPDTGLRSSLAHECSLWPFSVVISVAFIGSGRWKTSGKAARA